jgi:hypothetical protein
MARWTADDVADFVKRGGRAQAAVNAAIAKAAPKKRSGKSELEGAFREQLRVAGVRLPIMQYSPFPLVSNIRLDCAWPVIPSDPHLDWQPGIAIEIQGMVHRIKEQFKADCRRHNMLVQAGWTVYYVDGEMVRDGSALELAKAVITPAGLRFRPGPE